MLRADVVEAARAGRFHVWAVTSVDEAMEALTGTPPGERGLDGSYPEETVNGRVARRLAGLAEKAQAFGSADRATDGP
jgi:predicted ATP-dependent protease